jgi:hypothetical protein
MTDKSLFVVLHIARLRHARRVMVIHYGPDTKPIVTNILDIGGYALLARELEEPRSDPKIDTYIPNGASRNG